MARKPAADNPDAPAKKRRRPSRSDAWRPPPLPWIMRAGRTDHAPVGASRFLCCDLPESFALAAHLKEAEITLLEPDFAVADAVRKAARRRRLTNLRVECAAVDQEALTELTGGNYDTVVAHDALHRAADPAAALRNLAAAASETGTVYLGLRGSTHPSGQLESVLGEFGIGCAEIDAENEQTTKIARLVGGLARCLPAETRDLADEFRQAAGRPLSEWLPLAADAGLHLRASTSTAQALPAALPGGGTALLATFSLSRLCRLLDTLLRPPTHQLLFSRQRPVEPPWQQPEDLRSWRPVSRFLDLSKLDPLPPPLTDAASVEVDIDGVLSPQNFTLTRYMLEVLRRSNGQRTIGEIMAEIPHTTEINQLLPAFHFLHHAFILELVLTEPT